MFTLAKDAEDSKNAQLSTFAIHYEYLDTLVTFIIKVKLPLPDVWTTRNDDVP